MLSWWVGVLLLAGGAAAICPQRCSCFTDPDGYISANCSTLSLSEEVLPSSVELLSLQPRLGGYATKLAPRAFLSFQKVKFLWAINCSILNLPNEVFHGLHYVIRIDLSYNKIRHLNGAVFKNLGSLTTLKLRGNPLELTPWDAVVSDGLQELDMGHCGLRVIPFGTFATVPRLSRLYLDGNELRTFTFNSIPMGLRYVNFAHNRIANVPVDVLIAMTYLRKVDLSKNPINCTCSLLLMQDWLSGQGVIMDNGVTCSLPAQYTGTRLSKINENELCTLEEMRMQRKINDLQNYRDSKSHRTHNMIHDPDLQSDQPSGQIYAEVLFHDEGTHGLTHMELSEKHYPPLPSDLSDENNKVAASKQELPSTEVDLVSPTQTAETKEDTESSREELTHEEFIDHIKDPDSLEDETKQPLSTEQIHEIDTWNSTENLPLHSRIVGTEHTTDVTNWEHTSIITSDALLNTSLSLHANETKPTKSAHEELADEGYSPVYNMSDIMLSDAEEGSGEAPDTFYSKEDDVTSTSQPFTFPFSVSDTSDYNYDSHHDYSGEVSSTTEKMSYVFVEEGSGEGENETLSSIEPLLLGEEENETTTDNYYNVERSTDYLYNASSESTSGDYSLVDVHYSSSSESPTDEIQTEPTVTEEETTDMFSWSSSSTYSSVETSSSESTQSSTESYTSTNIHFASSEVPSSSTESPSSTESVELPITPTETSSSSEMPSSSTESPTSSSEAPTSSSEAPISSSEAPTSSSEAPFSSSLPLFHDTFSKEPGTSEDSGESTSPTYKETTPTSLQPTFDSSSTMIAPISEVEVIKQETHDTNEKIVVSPTKDGLEKNEKTEAAQSTLSYVIAGLLIALILLIATTVICRKLSKMRPCASKKKVRLPQDTEANHGTEMQDMLLPKPPENGVKIISQNGKEVPNGKEVKEEEVPVLQKDWEEKPEPIETVTARMSILAGPQTPVFIHKTLA